MRKKLILMMLAAVLSPVALFAQGKQDSSDAAASDKPEFTLIGQTLTIEQAIKIALERNQDILSARLDAAMSDSASQQYQGKYDFMLKAEGGLRYQEYPAALQGQNGKDQTAYDATASIAKMFSTGTTVSAGFTEEYVKTTGGKIPEYYQPVMFASIQQELLKNSFGMSDRSQERVLENAARMQRNAQIQVMSGLVVGTLVDVWDVTLKRSARDIAAQSLKETRRVRDVIAGNVRLGISETYDLNLYNSMVANAESQFAAAEQYYRDSVRTLYRAFNAEINGEVPELSGITILTDTYSEINIEEALKTAYAKRVDYTNSLIALESAKDGLSIAKSDQLPSLTVTGSVSSVAVEETMPTANTKAAGLDTPTYSVRVAATYPLGQTAQKTSARDGRFKVRQAELAIEKVKRAVRDDVIGKSEQIKVMFTAYQKAKTSRQESERYYQSVVGNLRMGKVSVTVVKTALDSLNASRQQELAALVQYNVALLQFDLATNELLEKYNVDINSYIAAAQ
jgi:outer membrane protein TolC